MALSRPGVSHVNSGAGDAYEEKFRNKMKEGVGGGTNSSSRPGVQHVSKDASDGFEARLRRKSKKEDERSSTNNSKQPMPKRGSLPTSCQTRTGEVSRRTQQRRASVSSATSDDYEKKIQAKMAAQDQQRSAAKALRNEMNRETKKVNRRSSMPAQSTSAVSAAAETAANYALRSRRPSRRDDLNAKLNEHKSSLSSMSMQSKNNEDEELFAARGSNRRPSRRDALDAKVNEVRSSLKESTPSQTSIISDMPSKYNDNGMVTRRSALEAKLAAKRRSSAMSVGSVGSGAGARSGSVASGGGGMSCGASAGSKSTLDEKLARKRFSNSTGSNDKSGGIVDLSVSAGEKRKKSKERSSKGGRKGTSSAPSTERSDQSQQGSQHEESWDALDDVLRQAQMLSMSEK